VTFDSDVAASAVMIEVTAETLGQTGVEMEALTGGVRWPPDHL
jgi:molybdenum cofactor biosynthesis enzyme